MSEKTEDIQNENTQDLNNKSELDETIEKETEGFLAAESKDEQIQALEQQVEKFRKEAEEMKDSWTRERAEFQNYKKRTVNEFAHIKREAVKGFVANLLNPIDNLERVTSGAEISEEIRPFADGVQMIHKELLSVLEKESIIKLIPQKEAFDPTCMEAIASEESEEYSEETVTEVYQAGYIFKNNDEQFVLRPARVKVGKPISN